MEITLIEKLMEVLADMRNVAVDVIKSELASDNEQTHNEIFQLACAWRACQ